MPSADRDTLLQTAAASQWLSHHTAKVLDPRKAGDFCRKPGYAFERQVFEATYELMAIALEREDIQSAEDFEHFIIDELAKLKRLLKQNVTAVMQPLRAVDQTARSAQAYFLSASPAGKQENTWFFAMNPEDPSVLSALCDYLLELFDDWVIGESPALIAYDGCPPQDVVDALKQVAMRTNALLLFNVEHQDSLADLLEYARYNTWASADDDAAHAAAWCTPLAAREVIYDDEDYEEDMPPVIGGALPIAGRFRALDNPAKLPAGMRQGKLRGVTGPLYQTRKTPTTTLGEKYRLNPVALIEQKPTGVGGYTLSTSDDESVNLISKVAVQNRIVRALCQQSTSITFENVDLELEQAVKKAITTYLNSQKTGGVIKDYDDNSIAIDQHPDHPQHYTIHVDVALHQAALYWEIQLNTIRSGNSLSVKDATVAKK